MAPRREHGLQADRGHAACVVAPHLAQASDARGTATPPQGTPKHPPSCLPFFKFNPRSGDMESFYGGKALE